MNILHIGQGGFVHQHDLVHTIERFHFMSALLELLFHKIHQSGISACVGVWFGLLLLAVSCDCTEPYARFSEETVYLAE